MRGDGEFSKGYEREKGIDMYPAKNYSVAKKQDVLTAYRRISSKYSKALKELAK